jgi:hypothetical protein
MRQIARQPPRFDIIKILDSHARRRGFDILDQANHSAFLADMADQIEKNRTNDILIYGLRAEAMFAFVASALGRCKAIKEEDAGDLYATDLAMKVPDFRIVTVDNREFLVEVKNWNERDPRKNYSLSHTYFSGLKQYASLFNKELFIGLFWSPQQLWILVSADDFERRNGSYELSLMEAIARNQMQLLGDYMIGTTPSLTLKLLSDPTKPRSVDASGMAAFTIGAVEIYAGDQRIVDDTEKNIAWFLMNYGDWPAHELPPEVVNDELVSIGFRVEPRERANPSQHFEMIGNLCAMISRQFNHVTAPDGSVAHLSPAREPDTFGVVIPVGYRGDRLPLWRFTMMPADTARLDVADPCEV